MKKRNRIILLSVGVSAVIIIVAALKVWYSHPPSTMLKDRMENDFRRNEEQLLIVAEHCKNSTYDTLRLPSFRNARMMFAGLEHGDVPIGSNEVSKAISSLLRFGYNSVNKSENSIIFTRWGNKNRTYGIVYSIDGNAPNESSFDYYVFLGRLQEDNWYYYEGFWRYP